MIDESDSVFFRGSGNSDFCLIGCDDSPCDRERGFKISVMGRSSVGTVQLLRELCRCQRKINLIVYDCMGTIIFGFIFICDGIKI